MARTHGKVVRFDVSVCACIPSLGSDKVGFKAVQISSSLLVSRVAFQTYVYVRPWARWSKAHDDGRQIEADDSLEDARVCRFGGNA